MSVGFANDYHAARSAFLSALNDFEAHTQNKFVRERHSIDAAADLTIDIAELRPASVEKTYVVVAGIHGIEGYAGSAILRALLGGVLRRLDFERAGLLCVHGLNPSGMFHRRRVNARNVDLNRNFDAGDGALYASGLGAYATVSKLLAPADACDSGLSSRVRFFAQVATAIARHGFAPLRQATLAGQYGDARGLFFGGTEREPETRAFETCFARAATSASEILLTDLHTGYGARGQVSSLFAKTDSAEVRALTESGVADRRGRDQAYAARGDLIGFCAAAAKRLRPEGVFNGVVVELGTRGLSPLQQLKDLYALVCENQAVHNGASSLAVSLKVRHLFEELFNPSSDDWRAAVVDKTVTHIEALLAARGFLRAA